MFNMRPSNGRLFGYRIEPDFDLAKEKRRDRVGWLLIVATVSCILYDALGGHLQLQWFQGAFATILCYGDSFYAARRADLRSPWLWKTILASLPLHVIYLAALFSLDKMFPGVMKIYGVFMLVIIIAFAIEANLIDRIADHFKPRKIETKIQAAAE